MKDDELSTSLKSEDDMSSLGSDLIRPPRSSKSRIVQNFRLVWVDEIIDAIKEDDCRNTINHLKEVVNHVDAFVDVDECVDFISDINDEKVFVICSGAFGKTIIPYLHEMSQVSVIYIFCYEKINYQQWAKQWAKIKGVYDRIEPICEALKQAVKECEQNSISMSFIGPTSTTTNENRDQLDQSFMYTQLLKEILLTIDFEEKHIYEFISYCRGQFAKNPAELRNIDTFEQEYHFHDPIWWYTYQRFLYSMLNRALRMMEVDLIITMGFFVRRLHERIEQLHLIQYKRSNCPKTFTVYRGQGLSQTDFDKLLKTRGGLLSFNNFLSTSSDIEESLKFSRETLRTSDLVGILFIMKINPSQSSVYFADVSNISYYRKEKEILFSTHSIFRIGEINKFDENNRLWKVELTLTNDHDSQLDNLTKHIREETFAGHKGWYRLGYLLIKLGQYDKSEELFNIMLDKTAEDDYQELLFIYHMLAMVKDNQGEYTTAITFYEKSIEIKQMILPSMDCSLAASYNNIGLVYEKMNEYSKALSFHKQALDIREKSLSSYHVDLAQSYACHGSIYASMKKYSIALSYYDKAHEIYQIALPDNHPDLATSYYNIGSIYSEMDDISKALSFCERALNIGRQSLTPNHPHLRLYIDKVETIQNQSESFTFRL